MAKKTKTNDGSAIKLFDLFGAINRKDKSWWETLTKEQQYKFSGWLYNRYMSSSRGSADLQRYYLMGTNIHSNRNFGSLKRHPKLQYLLFTTLPFETGESDHNFVPVMKQLKSDDASTNKKFKALRDLCPTEKYDDLALKAELLSDDEFLELLASYGLTDSEIKSIINN